MRRQLRRANAVEYDLHVRKLMMTFAGALALALNPVPAHADNGLSVLQTFSIFVLGPLSIWGVIWFLWMLPEWRRRKANRHGSSENLLP